MVLVSVLIAPALMAVATAAERRLGSSAAGWIAALPVSLAFAVLAVAVYGLSMIYSVFLWRKGFRQDNRVNYLLLLAGFCFHTTAMVKRGFSLNHCPVTNLYEATLFAAWTIVVMYLARSMRHSKGT